MVLPVDAAVVAMQLRHPKIKLIQFHFQSTTAERVECSGTALSVGLSDGRTIVVPVSWFPRLAHGTETERNNWRLIAKGHGIHWPELDENISVENLLAGQRSGESQTSLKKWLATRS
jgi:hypothetical protein